MRKTFVIKEATTMHLYGVDVEERPYLEKDALADFVTEMVYATLTNTTTKKEDYKATVLSSILCNFDIRNIYYASKIHLN